MKKVLILIFPLFLFSIPLLAQEEPIEVHKNTLNDQMIEVFEKSNSYQEYKVIKKTELATLKRNILDSVAYLKNEIKTKQSELQLGKKKIDSLNSSLRETQESLEISREKEDGIKVLGILTSKSTYNTVMWCIILLLLAVGGFLFYKFLNSNKVTNAAELKIAELEIELEDLRRNHLEREQKLRRKLQDEINKNRKI